MMNSNSRFLVHLVEKDPITAMILKSRLVEKEGLDITTFGTEEECLRQSNSSPDVVVLHQQHGTHENQSQLLAKMKRRNPKIRFILFSDDYDRNTMFQFINDSSATYLSRNTGRFSVKVPEMVLEMWRSAIGFSTNRAV